MHKYNSFKKIIGCWLNERWHAEKVLAWWIPQKFRPSWKNLRNRNEKILMLSEDQSIECCWEHSSYLTVAMTFPRVGGRLFEHCANLNPFGIKEDIIEQKRQRVKLSILIPFGGKDRIKQLLFVLKTFYSQDTQNFEIILIGDKLSEIKAFIGKKKRLRYVECETENGNWNKSFFLNRGVDSSSAEYIMLHDADIAVPNNYINRVLRVFERGWEGVYPIRFLFYFDKCSTENFISTKGSILPKRIEEVRANFHGGSVALTREAYSRIGGMNEELGTRGFHDVEFNQRNMTNNVFKGRFLPAIHLWHKADRNIKGKPIEKKFAEINKILVKKRIETLNTRYIRKNKD